MEDPRFRPAGRKAPIIVGPKPAITIGPETLVTRTLGQIWEEERSRAAYLLFLYRSHELGMTDLSVTHYIEPAAEITPLAQHSKNNDIHSCVNTNQLNAMLWQGQISQVTAESVNASLTDELRSYFNDAELLILSNQVVKIGNLAISEHFEEIVPDADFSYYDVQFAGEDLARVALTELSRGSVLSMDLPEHVVLAVGYVNLNQTQPEETNLIVVDPLTPHHQRAQKIASFRKCSLILPSLTDPVRNVAADFAKSGK